MKKLLSFLTSGTLLFATVTSNSLPVSAYGQQIYNLTSPYTRTVLFPGIPLVEFYVHKEQSGITVTSNVNFLGINDSIGTITIVYSRDGHQGKAQAYSLIYFSLQGKLEIHKPIEALWFRYRDQKEEVFI
jgi:hypothetical protein